MHVEHHRALPRQARRPDVHLQHVLALPAVIPVEEKRLLYTRPRMQSLRAIRAVGQSRILILPWNWRLGWKPPILAGCGRSVGHTFERQYASIHESSHFAVLGLRNRRPRGRHVSWF